MAQLLVRNIEKSVVLKLKRRAAKQGVSMEEAHRQLLRKFLEEVPKPKMSFLDYLCTMPNVGNDSDFRMPRDDKPREVELSD